MNRQIKFRAWHDVDCFMFLCDGISGVSPLYYAWNNQEDCNYAIKGEHLMQFTGLKDKNGVDIYEGDIVSFELSDHNGDMDKYIAQIKWDDFCACYEVRTEDNEWLLDMNEGLDVIGNIYQNPELLTT